jgi:2-haloacid dehalogenase
MKKITRKTFIQANLPFAGWDMAGAKWFGYTTFWLNRLKASPEMLDAKPDGQGNSLHDLLEFVRTYNKN